MQLTISKQGDVIRVHNLWHMIAQVEGNLITFHEPVTPPELDFMNKVVEMYPALLKSVKEVGV